MKLFNIVVPSRPTSVHKHPCKHCPSVVSGETDQDMIDMKTAARSEQVEAAFTCGWRPGKLCKGYCDYYGLDQTDFKKGP